MNCRAFRTSFMIVVSALAACDNDEPGGLSLPEISPPGWLDVRLTGDPGNSEALLFEVVGGPADSVASENHRVFTNVQTPERLRVLLVGDLTNDVVAKVWVPNPSELDRYQIVLEQAAEGQEFQQEPVSTYSLSLEVPARR